VDFTDDERELYKAVEARARVSINRYLNENNVMKNYSSILAMLVRLRQVCPLISSHNSFVSIRSSSWNISMTNGQ
jgi:NRPS condensation-like uncharacterized protein